MLPECLKAEVGSNIFLWLLDKKNPLITFQHIVIQVLSEETRPLNHLFTLFSGFIRSSLRLCSITGLMAPLQMCKGVLCTYFRLWKVAEIPEGKYDFQNSQLALRRSLVFCFVVFLVYYLKLCHSNWMVTFFVLFENTKPNDLLKSQICLLVACFMLFQTFLPRAERTKPC